MLYIYPSLFGIEHMLKEPNGPHRKSHARPCRATAHNDGHCSHSVMTQEPASTRGLVAVEK
jgi:hypothetical protein